MALGLLTALGSVMLLCLSAYEWLTGEETELEEEDEDSAEEVPAADSKTEEAAPVQEEAE